jgi:hypothetical protein
MTRRVGPYSRLDLPTFSGKTREGAFLRGVRAELVKHVGGRPSATQSALIEAAAQLRLRISLMDRRFSETRTQTEHDSRTYLAWVGSLGRLMQRLDGLQPAPTPKDKRPFWEQMHTPPDLVNEAAP